MDQTGSGIHGESPWSIVIYPLTCEREEVQASIVAMEPHTTNEE